MLYIEDHHASGARVVKMTLACGNVSAVSSQ